MRAGHPIVPGTVETVADAVDGAEAVGPMLDDVVWRNGQLVVTPRTAGQKRYVDAMRANTITFGIGPAGTGKTYLAVAIATAALMRREVARIILTRPAVEAGERLGFLPGDLAAKVDPYLRPLFDALYDMLEAERVEALFERGQIEVAPLAFMRGRSLNDSFIILDEAQNTTPEQMKMFLTRLGLRLADDRQRRHHPDRPAGGADARAWSACIDVLEGVEDIAFVRLDRRDVVRHRLVQRIVDAYGAAERAPGRRVIEVEARGEDADDGAPGGAPRVGLRAPGRGAREPRPDGRRPRRDGRDQRRAPRQARARPTCWRSRWTAPRRSSGRPRARPPSSATS